MRSKEYALAKLTIALLLLSPATAAQALSNPRPVQIAQEQNKHIPVAVKVEAEGEGKGRGMWTQSAKDLTLREVQILQSLLVAAIKKQDGIQIAPLTYSGDCVGIAVVGAKLPDGNGGTWYVTSSAVILSRKNGTDEFITHNIESGPDLSSVATTIAYEFASVRLAAAASLRQ